MHISPGGELQTGPSWPSLGRSSATPACEWLGGQDCPAVLHHAKIRRSFRFRAALQTRPTPGCAHIVSIESDSVHVLVARHIIALAGLSQEAEILPGMAHDVLDRLVEDWGAGQQPWESQSRP